MKKTDLEEIKAEEKRFMGKEMPEPEVTGKIKHYDDMKVEWLYPLSDTYYEWVKAACHACLATWEQYPYDEINKMVDKEEKLLAILEERPISVALEMPKFAFKITGITRAMTHQLVRHRKMAFGQQSIRVVDPTGAPVRIPEAFKEMHDERASELAKEYYAAVDANKKLYKKLVRNEVPREQARNILPIGTTTSIVVTADLRTMIDYFKSRTIGITQGEHHYLVYLIAKEMQKVQPRFFEFICERVNGLKELVAKDWEKLVGGDNE